MLCSPLETVFAMVPRQRSKPCPVSSNVLLADRVVLTIPLRWLSQCLYYSGYIEWGQIMAEQRIIRDNQVEHWAMRCDICTRMPIVGVRYTCLSCLDTDICKGCYQEWRSTNASGFCKAHSFAQVPRHCWYSLSDGMVTESGQTLADVLDQVEAVFLSGPVPVDIHNSG